MKQHSKQFKIKIFQNWIAEKPADENAWLLQQNLKIHFLKNNVVTFANDNKIGTRSVLDGLQAGFIELESVAATWRDNKVDDEHYDHEVRIANLEKQVRELIGKIIGNNTTGYQENNHNS
jgi:uncharacterized membrane protein